MFLYKILKTKNRFRAYPTPQAVQTTGSTAEVKHEGFFLLLIRTGLPRG